ncbi:MAG: hypothetical protein QW179_01730 [Candidatus Hadarchaeales archaeon]
MESWEILYIGVLLIGLLLGWLISPYIGAAFVWGLVILLEFLFSRKAKR